MPFPARLPKNAWASPSEKIQGSRKVNQSNMIKNMKSGHDLMPKSVREGTSLPYLSSPPPQQIKINYNNNNNRMGKIVIAHSSKRTTNGGDKG